MQKQRSLLALILVLVIAAIIVIVKIPIRLGLDLLGGAQLTIQVKPTQDVKQITPDVLEAVQRVIENRINGLGVSESLVQTVGQDQIVVQLPGVSDPQQAERVLGGTAQLDFRKQKPGTEAQLFAEQQIARELKAQREQLRKAGDKTKLAEIQTKINSSNEAIASLYERTNPPLTGKNLKDAFATTDQAAVNWSVALRFDGQGGDLFAELTKNIAGTGRTLGIFLDNELISAATVDVKYAQAGITGGSAEISGRFTVQEAQDLAIQLKGGALPVPVEIVENRTVGATLGKDSIQSSIYAGMAGLFLVLIFMVFYYRLPGLIADLALIVYSLLTLASFALVNVTLTLPGIAGFILSIGMAVDANVLIFERTREELRAGKSLYRAVESGFYRAFSSILDSNVTTWIACGALFWLGSGLVKGFALTLALGVAVSMFTAITCSRTLLMFAISIPELRKPEYYAPKKVEVSP
ncbi:protein translocase subunit SecD [Planktothrix sp. FACHB-1355]|uniref:Protein translocase subunit SecD n=1 Tax=Aerosakkonema funiforme FACHB-1375 TaxID=2949571 RepID=A0A926ZFZ0_9CYAN|nr:MULTISPECIES: protein translocase subunit SecD [Oscillatoriales]MBD2181628.1 protein translocase subunit SecD [Aerosakkonema funiforme FACHB-1375]MBD3559196.1 protein translocase subunit SecD [Planktothrix sp. FACHB-1355]